MTRGNPTKPAVCPECARPYTPVATTMPEDYPRIEAGATTTPCVWCGRPDGCDCQARIACVVAGTAGHYQCGMCPTHSKPRFACGCPSWRDS